MEKKQGEQMVSEFILYLALIQLGAVTAVTAAVVGVLLLIYRSVPNRNSEICSGVETTRTRVILEKGNEQPSNSYKRQLN